MNYKKSILAGLAIGLGCIAYLSVEDRYIGAFLFSIGLLTICGMKWELFTGKLCRCELSSKDLALVFAYNAVGALFACACYALSGGTAAETVAVKKFSRPLQEAFISAILCEICIYIAVIGYREIKYEIGKYLAIVLGVMVFILGGFEHCIADCFYFWAYISPENILQALLFMGVVVLGNIFGAILMNVLDEQVIQPAAVTEENEPILKLVGENLDKCRERIKFYFDMDGVLAKWDSNASIEDTYKPGFFQTREADAKMVALVKLLIKLGYNVAILSSAYTETTARTEKTAWLAAVGLGDIEQIYSPYGEEKYDYITSQDQVNILVDDFTEVLNSWQQRGGIGFKYYTTENGHKKSWDGYSINQRMSVKKMATVLISVAEKEAQSA